MTDFRERYKRAGFGREDLRVNRTLRSQRRNEARRNQRDEQLDSLRIDLVPDCLETIPHQESSSNSLQHKNDKVSCLQTESSAEEGLQKRLLELEKWRKEKNKRKIDEKKKAKPVFKVGVVHHKVYSPPLNKSSTQTSAQKQCKTVKLSQPEAPVKRITRATEKRLAVKSVTSQQKRENMRIKKKQQVQSDCATNNFFKMTPLAPNDHEFKSPTGITPMQMFGRQISKAEIDTKLDFSFSDISSTKEHFPVQTSSINLQSNNDISFNMSQPSEITFGMQKTSTHLETSKNAISWNAVPEVERHNNQENVEPSGSIPREKIDNLQNLSLNLTLPLENDTPTVYSPYVVTSRGKNNIRKELKKRMSHQLNSSDIPTKDTVMQNLNISAQDEERTAQYYEFILDRETDRLNQLCDTWNKIKETPGIPEDIKYQIQADVGQTQLLLNKKFKRFRSLVEDCKLRKEGMLVTSKDLQGFWEMSCAEVKQCDNRFDRLEKLKEKHWVIEDQDDVEQAKKVVQKKTVVKKAPAKKKINATSSLRAHIMAARKKLENTDNNVDPKLTDNGKTAVLKTEVLKSPKTARRSVSTTASVDRRCSLLRKVQSSQENKRTSSPLVQMKISQMCKTPEVRLDGSIIYINSNRTPAKGILKSINNDVNRSIKQSNKVLFKEEPMEVDELEKKDFGHPKPVERQLSFEDDSYESLPVEDKKELTEVSHTQKALNDSHKNIKVTVSPASPVTSTSPLNLNNSKSRKNSKKQITFNFSSIEENVSTRMTRRSCKFSVPLTPKSMKDTSEINDSLIEANDNSYCDSPRPDKELFINEKGFVTRSTPRLMELRLNNSEESSPDTTLTEEYSPNAKTNELLTRRTPKRKISSATSNSEKEKVSSGSKLKRTKSMVNNNLVNHKISEELVTPKLRRSSSHRQKKSSPSVFTEKTNTPNLNRRRSERLHHQINLNEKTEDLNKSSKSSKTRT